MNERKNGSTAFRSPCVGASSCRTTFSNIYTSTKTPTPFTKTIPNRQQNSTSAYYFIKAIKYFKHKFLLYIFVVSFLVLIIKICHYHSAKWGHQKTRSLVGLAGWGAWWGRAHTDPGPPPPPRDGVHQTGDPATSTLLPSELNLLEKHEWRKDGLREEQGPPSPSLYISSIRTGHKENRTMADSQLLQEQERNNGSGGRPPCTGHAEEDPHLILEKHRSLQASPRYLLGCAVSVRLPAVVGGVIWL